MSIESTKPVLTITGTMNRDLINAQPKHPSQPLQAEHAVAVSTNVSLKETSSLLVSPTNDINMEKIAKIKQAIEAGDLVINTAKIADALLKNTLEEITYEMDYEGE